MATTTTTTATATAVPPALLTAIDSNNHIHLVIGSNALAAARVSRSLEVGATPILIAPTTSALPHVLTRRIEEKQIQWLQRGFSEQDLTTLGRPEVDHIVDAVFITSPGATAANSALAARCRRLRIPVNVVDAPLLCTFTLLSTHSAGPLQIGVTTSGRGCKLASRIRREIAAALPPDLGEAVDRLGTMRRKIWEQDREDQARAGEQSEAAESETAPTIPVEYDAEDDDAGQTAAFNKLILPTDADAAKARRMRWLAQICEYWPLQRLAAITDDDVTTILEAYQQDPRSPVTTTTATTTPGVSLPAPRPRQGRIILAGSGPGHPDLLTTATLKALRSADLILADKLVPAGVLALAPRRTPLHIARKFPGNADAAQDELHSLALAALQQGRSVLRLKQGDPYLYGRGAEEVAFFRTHGYEPLVLPGVTSALSAPLFAAIPATHRAVADQLLICTGTGRHGAKPVRPEWRESQTVVFLMALHRLADLVESLTTRRHPGPTYPLDTPCAVIERASCPDQRVIRTTLRFVVAAVETEGSRPPGLLVVGRACEVQPRWIVEDGWRGLDGLESFGGGAHSSATNPSTTTTTTNNNILIKTTTVTLRSSSAARASPPSAKCC
ncbi:uroporphyrinogen-III C-methyltransferase [Dissoconium aciculare CBS 342.82]|uniref:Uroporphyrinogen-III C-methyltransferase n=1 Tax=Dissoconium aciculare CBS 342.82 TaxID=1314786 RepID=A0A6J3LUI6_9PEZI|nr:uroporphyrinogen-III C-methyltransferase [Dissoconium aciculare CBS 342.82]KAF1819313.1 uroporphyrinogen-III C-methyltransferase [Dissoconium aciculare CBS 342.82]